MSEISLDNFDYAILRILQKTIKLPIEKFLKNRSIRCICTKAYNSDGRKGNYFKNCAILNPLKFGEKITSIIEVRLSEDRSIVMDRAKLYFASVEEIQQCYFVNGGVSFIIIMLSNNLSHFESLVRKHFADNEDVKTYRTLIVLDRVKVNFELNI